jgi:glucuronate isomerase
MKANLVATLLTELKKMPIIDPHTHVRQWQPVARHLGDLLGYHYYTELSNSSRGEPVPLPDDPDERIDYVWPHLKDLRGTVQFDWMMGISEVFFGIKRGEWFTKPKKDIVKRAQKTIQSKSYEKMVWQKSNVTQVYLTNQFDEKLDDVKDARLIPCLRTDDLVFNADTNKSIERLDAFLKVKSGASLAAWRGAVKSVFDHFVKHKMAYCAVSFPPSFTVEPVNDAAAAALLKLLAAGKRLSVDEKKTWASFAVIEIAKECRRTKTPYVLMAGAVRGVYAQGVPSGQDLFSSDGSLRGYDWLLNEFPDVKFPFMAVNDTAGMELATMGWIRHNVYPFSHWWYTNNPLDIRRELRRRLDVLPRTKFIGYHSDGYSLEFTLPKFNTFRLQLAIVLAERIEEGKIGGSTVIEPLSVSGALELAERIMLTNCGAILGK